MRATEIPYIVYENDECAVVYKPPRMHCAPLQKNNEETLVDWFAAQTPVILTVKGKKAGEGGLVHRLDYSTRGLVLFAKTQNYFDFLQSEQKENRFEKEYRALCRQEPAALPGFPPHPPFAAIPGEIESYFRAFGPGRKEVRPVIKLNPSGTIDSGGSGYYRTQICDAKKIPQPASSGAVHSFCIKIKRGFRHQIRCHLAWIGYPIINDEIYGSPVRAAGNLALCSTGLKWTNGEYHIACKELELSADSG